MADKKTVFITGASGSMGNEVLKQIIETEKFNCLILLRRKPANEKLATELTKKYGSLLTVKFGDVSNIDDCKECVEKSDYVIHCAAIISPTADYNPKASEKANYYGTKNLVDAVKSSPRAQDIKFVGVGTVAEYGHRDYKHPWGRVGDPLLMSVYDFYAVTKTRAERYLLEADLPNWVSIRQSGILYDNLLKNNMDDGIMFHTPWNVFIEWVTARDSGLLLKNLVLRDSDNTLKPGFWQKVYNIGGGESCRVTGFETINAGFELMGGNAKKFFKPRWNVTRNFHCFWYYDSDVLNDYLDFQTESFDAFWKNMSKLYWYFKAGKIVPSALIRKMMIEKLFKTSPNSPMYWFNNNMEKRITTFYGSMDEFNAVPLDWEGYPLICEGVLPDGKNTPVNYTEFKKKSNAAKYLLDHGYDESKPDSELDIADMQAAAKFRGGKCLSTSMTKGDLYTKLTWESHIGHKFESSPYTILKTGHWCPKSCSPPPWNFDELAEKIPFFAQVWHDTHDPSERNFYDENCYKDIAK